MGKLRRCRKKAFDIDGQDGQDGANPSERSLILCILYIDVKALSSVVL
jgi:hypothetical protein